MPQSIQTRRRRLRVHLFASRLHKWLALLIGAQLLLWFASGAVMSFLPIGEVRGEHLVSRSQQAPIPPGVALAPNERLLEAAGGPVDSITLRMLDGRAVAEVVVGKRTLLLDARSAAPLGTVDAAMAGRIATGAWLRSAPRIDGIGAVERESTEYRGPLPAWRVKFSDNDETAVFVAADTGRVTGVRTGTWRFYDLFWGLHIMDWKNHEDTNSPWLVAFALGALMLGLAGTVLLVMRWPLRRRRQRSGR